jgi:hypothetical protein
MLPRRRRPCPAVAPGARAACARRDLREGTFGSFKARLWIRARGRRARRRAGRSPERSEAQVPRTRPAESQGLPVIRGTRNRFPPKRIAGGRAVEGQLPLRLVEIGELRVGGDAVEGVRASTKGPDDVRGKAEGDELERRSPAAEEAPRRFRRTTKTVEEEEGAGDDRHRRDPRGHRAADQVAPAGQPADEDEAPEAERSQTRRTAGPVPSPSGRRNRPPTSASGASQRVQADWAYQPPTIACRTPRTGDEKSMTCAIERIQGKRKRAAAAYHCEAYRPRAGVPTRRGARRPRSRRRRRRGAAGRSPGSPRRGSRSRRRSRSRPGRQRRRGSRRGRRRAQFWARRARPPGGPGSRGRAPARVAEPAVDEGRLGHPRRGP